MKKVLVPLATLNLEENSFAPLHFVRETYIKKLLKYGLAPLFISPLTPTKIADELYNECDGVLLTGGSDFNPTLYKEKPHPKTEARELARDKFELEVIKKVLTDRKPFLGICRGCQALAIASGGSLHQHVPDIAPEETHSKINSYAEIADNETEVQIDKKSRLYGLLRKEKITVRCGHHQAVKTLGKNFKAVGFSLAGIIECVEYIDPSFFCFAVQSHPEIEENGDLEPLFEAFSSSVTKP